MLNKSHILPVFSIYLKLRYNVLFSVFHFTKAFVFSLQLFAQSNKQNRRKVKTPN